MLSDRFVVTEKVTIWKDYLDPKQETEIIHASKNYMVTWYNTKIAKNRRSSSWLLMTVEEFYAKFMTRYQMLNTAGFREWSVNNKMFAIEFGDVIIRPQTVSRGSETWSSSNIEGALIAWHMESCKTAMLMFGNKFPKEEDGKIGLPPPLMTKRILVEREKYLVKIFQKMNLGTVGYMKRCPMDWYNIKSF